MTAERSIVWTGRPGRPEARHVEWLWSARGAGGPAAAPHRVLPDACADVLLDGDGRAFVVGPLRAARVVGVAATGAITGARLRPGAVPAVLGVAAHELLDAHVALTDVAPALARRLDAELERVGGDGAGPATGALDRGVGAGSRPTTDALDRVGLAAALEIAIGAQVDAAPPDPQIAALVARLWRGDDERLGRLARELGLSERQLRRRCRDQLGHAPAELTRVMRLRRLLRLARALPHEPLAALAAAAGWHDQQHMTRDVRRLTGLTPARLLRRDGRSVQDRRAVAA